MFRFSDGLCNAMLDSGFATQFDSGFLDIYTGAQPATADAAPTGTLLATVTLPADALSVAAARVLSKQGTWEEDAALAAGVAGWGRFRLAGDPNTLDATQIRLDVSVGITGSGEDLILDNTNIAVGQRVVVNTFTFTQPKQ